jgi:hypothetical protein
MRTLLFRCVPVFLLGLISTIPTADAAGSRWAGQYRNEKLLGGRAVFQLSIEESDGKLQVSFDASWIDGHGAAPDAQGPGTVAGKRLTFKFEDSFSNSGTGTITRSGNDILVTVKPTHVEEPRCLAFYGTNMRLKRVAK